MSLRLAAALILTSVLPLSAQSLPKEANLSGWIEVERLFDNSGEGGTNFLIADLTFKLRPAAFNGFGVDLGYEGTRFDGLNLSAAYAAAVIPLGGGELSFGIPRAAIQQIFDLPAIGGHNFTQLVSGLLTEPDYLTAMSVSAPMYMLVTRTSVTGLRYDRNIGATRISAGLYQLKFMLDDFSTTDTVGQIAVEHGFGDTSLKFGLETVTSTDGTLVNILAGATTTVGQFDLGATARRLQQPANGGYLDSLRLDGVYHVNDALDVTANYHRTMQQQFTMLALSARYTVADTGYVEAGLISVDGSSAYQVSFGMTF